MTKPTDNPDDEPPPPRTVRVPIRRGLDPLASPQYAEVPEETADHWSERIWRDRP